MKQIISKLKCQPQRLHLINLIHLVKQQTRKKPPHPHHLSLRTYTHIHCLTNNQNYKQVQTAALIVSVHVIEMFET